MSQESPEVFDPVLLEGMSITPACGYLGPAKPAAGVYGQDASAIGFDDALLGRHVLFLGGIGTGKTVGMGALLESLYASVGADDVFVYFDTKGDYHQRFYRQGDAVLARGEATFAGQRTWNLFAELDSLPAAEREEELVELVSTLFSGIVEGADKNAMWAEIAKDLVTAVLTARLRQGAHLSNADVRDICDTMTLTQIHQLIHPHADLRGVLQYVAEEGSNTTVSVQLFVQQALRTLFRGTFAQAGDFSVRDFLRAKGARALFLEYDVAASETLKPVLRAVLDLALRESLSRGRAPGRVFVVLDEFALLPALTHLEPALNFGRSLGLRFIVGTQNTGQVLTAYGEGGAASVLSAFGTLFSYRLFDADSRKFVQDRYGANRKVLRYEAALKSRGVIEERVEGSVIEDWDMTGLGVGECLVALPDRPPVRFKFADPATSGHHIPTQSHTHSGETVGAR